MVEHAVIVRFNYGQTSLDPLVELEDELTEAIENADVGEYDGNEIAVDLTDGTIYMYGPNADALFKTVRPILKSTSFMKGATVTLRFGPPEDDVPERIETI